MGGILFLRFFFSSLWKIVLYQAVRTNTDLTLQETNSSFVSLLDASSFQQCSPSLSGDSRGRDTDLVVVFKAGRRPILILPHTDGGVASTGPSVPIPLKQHDYPKARADEEDSLGHGLVLLSWARHCPPPAVPPWNTAWHNANAKADRGRRPGDTSFTPTCCCWASIRSMCTVMQSRGLSTG